MSRLNQYGRRTFGRRTAPSRNSMQGDGVFDIAKQLYNKAGDFYGSSVGKSIINRMPSSDDTARPGYAGEKHTLLQLPNGRYGVANYMGPGTEVLKRLERNDPPRTKADEVAQLHDIEYAIAQTMANKDEQLRAVRQADERMIRNLSRIEREGGDHKKNIFQGKRGIQAKVVAEDGGVLSRDAFSGELRQYSDSEMRLLKGNRQRLTQKGLGVGLGVGGVGQLLKQEILRNMEKSKKRASQKGGFIFLAPLIAGAVAATKAAALGAAGAVGAYGANKALGGDGMLDIIKSVTVKKSDLPKMVVKEAMKAMEKIRQNAESDGDAKKQILAKIAKPLIPLIRKKLNEKIDKKMKGKGLKLGGQGLSLAGGSKMDSKILKEMARTL